MESDIIGVTLGVLGIIIGIVASYYFYKKSLRIKEPYWTIQSNNLIRDYSSRLNNLKVIYRGQEVKNLTVSKVIIWNKGAETINQQDIQTINPLRIVGNKDIEILDVKILACNNPSSQIEVQIQADGKSVLIDFEYLDQDQGAVIQVVHTGISSKNIEVIGDIKGVKKIINPGFTPIQMASMLKPHMRRKIIASLTLLIALALSISAGSSLLEIVSTPISIFSSDGVFALLAIVLTIAFDILAIRLYLSLWKPFSPSGLEIFEEEIRN